MLFRTPMTKAELTTRHLPVVDSLFVLTVGIIIIAVGVAFALR